MSNNINEERLIRLAKERYRQIESIPGVAGYLHGKTPPSTELQTLVGIANKAKMTIERSGKIEH